MSSGRQFARLKRGTEPVGPEFSLVPAEGMCLSAFLVIRPPGAERQVLLGRLDPAASWLELSALDPARVAAIGDRWMLPSCQLLLYESPEDAARRIAREQLAAASITLEGPAVFSDPYYRAGSRTKEMHWDLHFVFRGRWPSDRPPRSPVWRELAFLDPATLSGDEFARNQGDVLALVGLPPRSAAAAHPAPARRA
jgi:hypothetical protein